MTNIKLIRGKLEEGIHVGLKEQRDYIKWCINLELENEKIIKDFDKYNVNIPQFEFMINSLRAQLN